MSILREIKSGDTIHAALPGTLQTLCNLDYRDRGYVFTGRKISRRENLRLSINCDACYNEAQRVYQTPLVADGGEHSGSSAIAGTQSETKANARTEATGPTIVSFINYKGGVGKTTTAYHVSCSLAQHYRQKVLMIDIDPQTNLTFLCGRMDQWQRRHRAGRTIANLYKRFAERQQMDIKSFIWNSAVVVRGHPISGLDLIPCDINLLGEDLGGRQVSGTFNTMQALRENSQHYLRERSFLARVVDAVSDRYNWVVIDCPPNLYLMTQNALHASDYYIVTAIPDHLSTIGLNILTRKIGEIGEGISYAQTLAGSSDTRTVADLGAIVFVKVRIGGSMITITHEDTMRSIEFESFAEGKVVTRYTTELIGYSEAAQNRVPVWEHNSDNARRAARKNEYPEITRELIARFR